MPDELENKRIVAFDNMKGILIFLVVFAHILKNRVDAIPIVVGIYFFHMPAFVFISGFFSRGERSRNKYAILKLLAIYLVFNGLFMLAFGFRNPNALEPYYVMWYILSLIIWRLSAEKLSKVVNIKCYLVVAGLICGIWRSVDNTLALSRIITFAPFFMAGYLMSNEKMQSMVVKKEKRDFAISCAATAFALCGGIAAFRCFDFTVDDLTMDPYQNIVDFYERITFYMISAAAVFALLVLTPNRRLPFVTKIGRNSLGIYLCHRPITIMLSRHLPTMNLTGLVPIAIIGTLVICLTFGSDTVNRLLNVFFDTIAASACGIDSTNTRLYRAIKIFMLSLMVILALLPLISIVKGFQ